MLEVGDELVMGKSLIAFDTDHIKRYVFGTDKLKEIRGASSLLDRLNRIEMSKLGQDETIQAKPVYTHGGSGLFEVDTNKVEDFGRMVQKRYSELTHGGASITFAKQEILHNGPGENVWKMPLEDEFTLLHYHLRKEKDSPPDFITLPTHAFMRQCDACGIEYATGKDLNTRDPGEQKSLYCRSCLGKRDEDIKIKTDIKEFLKGNKASIDSPLWYKVINSLSNDGYDIPDNTERPADFNVFRNFKGEKEYMGLIYADANGMGKKLEICNILEDYYGFARNVDKAIYEAVCTAIKTHLKIKDHAREGDLETDINEHPLFPFDILLLGGDDVVMVTPATVALDVALTIARKFHEKTKEQFPEDERKHCTLSVGVVLAPVKYPFGPLLELAEDTLRFAKKEGTHASRPHATEYGETRINFVTITGNTSPSFQDTYNALCVKEEAGKKIKTGSFYATLRPYTIECLESLLKAIREGHQQGLNRTKLHQLREAVLKKNLTTSVEDGLAVLRNWQDEQRHYVVQKVYGFAGHELYQSEKDSSLKFPRVTFPWFADGEDMYSTPLLDLVELYDLVSREEESNVE